MKKFIVLLSCLCMIMLSGCTKTLSYTFNVSTGDKIKVQLTLDDNHTLSQKDGVFTISEKTAVSGELPVMDGIFLTEDDFNAYISAVMSEANATVIEQDSREDIEYYMLYEYADGSGHTEHNYICWVNDSNTGVLLGCTYDEETAREVFGMLEFSKEK